MIGGPWLIGGSVLAFALYSAFLIDWGGDMRENKIKLAAAVEAVGAKTEDDAAQSGAASVEGERLRREIARLNRQLEIVNVPTGLTCDAPGSGDSVHDAHRQLFEAGLPPVD